MLSSFYRARRTDPQARMVAHRLRGVTEDRGLIRDKELGFPATEN